MGGGLFDDGSAWDVESSIFVSLDAIKVGEAPERKQVTQEVTPRVFMQFGHDGMAAGQVRTR